MKFVFSESYILKWNGYTARNEKGISGTHNASMYLAEALARLNHEVIFVNVNNNIISGEYLNVKYINYDEFESCNCDYIITTYMTEDLKILSKILNYNKLIMIMNNPLYIPYIYRNRNLLQLVNPNKIIIAFISECSKYHILLRKSNNYLKYYNQILLHNSIDINDIKSITEKENSFIFFACLERGFKMAVEIRNRFNKDFKIYTNTYSNTDIYSQSESKNIIITENSSKNTILNYCAKSKYFIYSIVNLDTNNVHYDCAPYVILEALLSGVVVIAPRMKLFEELYGDAICYIDTTELISEKDLLFPGLDDKDCPLTIIPNFGRILIDKYVEKLNLLESNIDLYNSYVKKGILLKDKYDNIKIANFLLDSLSKVTDMSKEDIETILKINNNNNKIVLNNRLNKYK